MAPKKKTKKAAKKAPKKGKAPKKAPKKLPAKAPRPKKVPRPKKAPQPRKAPQPKKVPQPRKAPQPKKAPFRDILSVDELKKDIERALKVPELALRREQKLRAIIDKMRDEIDQKNREIREIKKELSEKIREVRTLEIKDAQRERDIKTEIEKEKERRKFTKEEQKKIREKRQAYRNQALSFPSKMVFDQNTLDGRAAELMRQALESLGAGKPFVKIEPDRTIDGQVTIPMSPGDAFHDMDLITKIQQLPEGFWISVGGDYAMGPEYNEELHGTERSKGQYIAQTLSYYTRTDYRGLTSAILAARKIDDGQQNRFRASKTTTIRLHWNSVNTQPDRYTEETI